LLIKSNGDVAYLEKSGELLVGAMEEARYTARSIMLGRGDSLFLYTDGVTEAMNERNELFSEERLQKELSEFQGAGVEGTISAVMQQIAEFTGSTPQSDDITMMMITYKGSE
jgi:sigma-B regulation protein RsbU (phosphoserine phosphatase)